MEVICVHIEKNKIIKCSIGKYQMTYLVNSILDAVTDTNELILIHIIDMFIKQLYDEESLIELLKLIKENNN